MKNNFRELFESPVGVVGRTGKADAESHITPELVSEFKKIVSKMGGKAVAQALLNSLSAPIKESTRDDDAKAHKALNNMDDSIVAFEEVMKKYDKQGTAIFSKESKKVFERATDLYEAEFGKEY